MERKEPEMNAGALRLMGLVWMGIRRGGGRQMDPTKLGWLSYRDRN